VTPPRLRIACAGVRCAIPPENNLIFHHPRALHIPREHAAGLGDASPHARLAVTTDQMNARWQILALSHQPITQVGGSQAKPAQSVGELNAIRDELTAPGVVAALAGVQVQQFTGNTGV